MVGRKRRKERRGDELNSRDHRNKKRNIRKDTHAPLEKRKKEKGIMH